MEIPDWLIDNNAIGPEHFRMRELMDSRNDRQYRKKDRDQLQNIDEKNINYLLFHTFHRFPWKNSPVSY